MIGIVAVIVITALGFDKLTMTLPNDSSFTTGNARESVVESLEKIADVADTRRPFLPPTRRPLRVFRPISP